MFLHKEGSGIWYLYYHDDSGTRRKVSAHTTRKPEAISFLKSFDPKPTPAVSVRSLNDLLNMFRQLTHGSYTRNTVEGFRVAMRQFIGVVEKAQQNFPTLARKTVGTAEKVSSKLPREAGALS